MAKNQVKIHIDQQLFESPDPTTGHALYALAGVPPDQQLFRKVPGDAEDEEIPDNEATLDLKQGDHFRTGPKKFTIIVNGRQRSTTKALLSFEDVVRLAYNEAPTGENILYTITYYRGPRENPEGNLLEGDTVKIKNGMVFDVRRTDKS